MTKKEISAPSIAVYRHCGQKESVIFCDRIMALGLLPRLQGRHLVRQGRHGGAREQVAIVEETRALAKDYEQQYQDGLITQGEKYNKVVDAWAKCSDRLAGEMMNRISTVQKDETAATARELDLHDEPLRGARLAGPDEAARRHARPDGQALRRDHREPDHLELQGRPRRARVLQLDARRPEGPGRHGAEDGELGLPHPPPRRRGAGRRHPRADCGSERGIRMRAIVDAGQVVASLASRILGRSTAEDLVAADGSIIVPQGTMIEESTSRRSPPPASRR
jgi:DNA-directed RNA polymerase subunit beta'